MLAYTHSKLSVFRCQQFWVISGYVAMVKIYYLIYIVIRIYCNLILHARYQGLLLLHSNPCGANTTVISPLILPDNSRVSITFEISPRINSSNTFVISLATHTWRSLIISLISDNVLTTRLGDSKKTIVLFSFTQDSSRFWRPFLRGRKPSNRKRCDGKPEAVIARISALGPGIGETNI